MKHRYDFFQTPFDVLDATVQKLIYCSFYHIVYPDIYFMIRDHFLTEDIIQESFLKAAKNAPALRSESNIPGWLRQIARRTALDKIKKLKKHRQMLTLSSVIHIDKSVLNELSVSNQVENKIRNELLHLSIAELKPDYRTMLYLFYMEGKSYREIGQELNLSETALTQRMARARKKLFKRFSEKWVGEPTTHPPSSPQTRSSQ